MNHWSNNGFNPADSGLNPVSTQGQMIGGVSASGYPVGGGGITGSCGGSAAQFDSLRIQKAYREPSLADQIESRISLLNGQIERLKDIRKKLADPNGALKVSVDDLRFLLNY